MYNSPWNILVTNVHIFLRKYYLFIINVLKATPKVILLWTNDIWNKNTSITIVVGQIWPDMWFRSLWDCGTKSRFSLIIVNCQTTINMSFLNTHALCYEATVYLIDINPKVFAISAMDHNQQDTWERNSVKFQLEHKYLLSRNCIWKRCLPNQAILSLTQFVKHKSHMFWPVWGFCCWEDQFGSQDSQGIFFLSCSKMKMIWGLASPKGTLISNAYSWKETFIFSWQFHRCLSLGVQFTTNQ